MIILLYLWFILYLAAIIFTFVQMFKGVYMTWRECGFFIFGVIFGGVPFAWLINQ
ncbi:hypothetical protein WKH57_01380 [Niallia taxi]|uniref:hypothetical protein n=1 Tax=Niallia taxi TaxID=2499688 RepID=UPI003179F29F